jgi:hypothetical protein
MAATIWERTNSFKSEVEWTSGSSYVDPSGNMSFIDVYSPEGILYISESGVRTATGIYHYYISTASDATLGLWIIDWSAYFSYESPFNYLPKHEREVIELVDVEMT